jgi:hypothetical protein
MTRVGSPPQEKDIAVQRWDSLIIQENFISEEQIEPLCRFFADELRNGHSQRAWNTRNGFHNYRFPATEEFWKLVRNDGNAAFLEAVNQDFDVTSIRLHCRRKLFVTGTHFDSQCNYVLGVSLSGEKIWSIKKVTYWDLIRHNYLPNAPYFSYDNIVHGESRLWHEKGQLHPHKAGALLFLPPGWNHMVIYTSDVVSFDLSILPKRKLAGGISKYSIPFLYGSRGKEHGEDHTGLVHWTLRHVLHAVTHLLRLVLLPSYFALSLWSWLVTPERVERTRKHFKPAPVSADGTPGLRGMDQAMLDIIDDFLRSRAELRRTSAQPELPPAKVA